MNGRACVSTRPDLLSQLTAVGPPPVQAEAAGHAADRDRATRAAIAEVHGAFDAAAMTELWDAALSAH